MSSKRSVDQSQHKSGKRPKKKTNVSSTELQVSCEINPKYVGDSVAKHCEKIDHPFRCYLLQDFITDEGFLKKVKNYLDYEIDYTPKRNDLYNFRQSADFKTFDDPHIVALRKCLLNEARVALSKLTGIEFFEDVIDITASKYEHNDILLCHDDQLEERRLAFILYLTPNWTESDGGLLNLIDHDENGQPTKTLKSITPQWNTFVCFEVTPISFHEVSEVLSETKCRLSVNGWFRGAKIKGSVSPYVETLTFMKWHENKVEEDFFTSWINPIYLDPLTQADIQEQFGETSEISLSDFLMKEKFTEISDVLRNSDLNWDDVFPPNRKHYQVLFRDNTPEILAQLVKVFTSEAMFLTLSNLTGLKLHPLAAADDSSDDENEVSHQSSDEPRCRFELRKWSSGCYTLIHDYDPDVIDERPKLDVVIAFNHDFEVNPDAGGFTTYIEKDSDEELLTVEPYSNTLAIVYRESKTVRFVKYLNSQHSNVYHDLELTFIP